MKRESHTKVVLYYVKGDDISCEEEYKRWVLARSISILASRRSILATHPPRVSDLCKEYVENDGW